MSFFFQKKYSGLLPGPGCIDLFQISTRSPRLPFKAPRLYVATEILTYLLHLLSACLCFPILLLANWIHVCCPLLHHALETEHQKQSQQESLGCDFLLDSLIFDLLRIVRQIRL